jgi:AraC-like DNA-binding protein
VDFCRDLLPYYLMKTDLRNPIRNAPTRDRSVLAELLANLVTTEGFGATALSDVRLMHSTASYPSAPVSYDPSIVIIAQGHKHGRLGGRQFVYDAHNYLVLSVPLPFECETIGSPEEPMLGMAVRVNPATIAELLLELDEPLPPGGSPTAIDATPLTPELSDAAIRLARCLQSPTEARILGPQIIREITFRALCGERGAGLRALATPQSNFNQIARALKRIHSDFAQTLEVSALAREAGMSVSTFHANFKAITANPPLRYLQTIRLHKAQVLMVSGTPVAEAARQVGYESASQFSREFKRLFGGTPKEVTGRSRVALTMF